MKKITLCLSAIVLSLTFNPIPAVAETPEASSATVELTPAEKAKADSLMFRLEEIKAMDKSNLSASEKRSLRKEVRTLKHELKAAGNGLYLSVAAIIIIILLLILIL